MTILPAAGAPVGESQQSPPPEAKPVALPSPAQEHGEVTPTTAPPQTPPPAEPLPSTSGGGYVDIDHEKVQQLVVPVPGQAITGPAPGVVDATPKETPVAPPPMPTAEAPIAPQEEKPLTPEEAMRIEQLQEQANNQRGVIAEASNSVPPPPAAPGTMIDIAPPIVIAQTAASPEPPTAPAPAAETAPPALEKTAPAPEPAPQNSTESQVPHPSPPTEPAPKQEDAYELILREINQTKVTHTEEALVNTPNDDTDEREPEPQPVRSIQDLDEAPANQLAGQLEARLLTNEGVKL